MYKQRFRRWGFRKNIRLDKTDNELTQYMLSSARDGRNNSSGPPGSAVQLASGQVVDLNRLVAHVRRKMVYRKHAQKTIALASVNPPKEFYIFEAILNDTRAYIVSPWKKRVDCLEGQTLT